MASTTQELTALALGELDRTCALLAGADPSAPTPCTGWSLDDLAAHVAAVAWQQGEAYQRARIGVRETPSYLEVPGDLAARAEALSIARHHLGDGIAAVEKGGDDTVVPLGAGTFPAAIAAAILVFEHGVHRYDVERALGRTPDIALDPVVAGTVVQLLRLGMLARMAKPADAPLAYRLTGDSASMQMAWRDGAWTQDVGDGPVCELRGSDAAIALVALGRIGVDHPALAVDDPAGIVASFPTHFHGI